MVVVMVMIPFMKTMIALLLMMMIDDRYDEKDEEENNSTGPYLSICCSASAVQ